MAWPKVSASVIVLTYVAINASLPYIRLDSITEIVIFSYKQEL